MDSERGELYFRLARIHEGAAERAAEHGTTFVAHDELAFGDIQQKAARFHRDEALRYWNLLDDRQR